MIPKPRSAFHRYDVASETVVACVVLGMANGRLPDVSRFSEEDRRRLGYLAQTAAGLPGFVVSRGCLLRYAEAARETVDDGGVPVPLLPDVPVSHQPEPDEVAAAWRLSTALDMAAYQAEWCRIRAIIVNAHDVLDRQRLMAHRMAARKLATDPGLLDRAVALIDAWEAEEPPAPVYRVEWRRVIAMGADEVRRRVVKRDDATTAWLTDSPLTIASGLFRNEAVRRRLYRKARQGLLLRALPLFPSP
jgi:hypothetical protein